jgi:hypothetical protein
LVPALGTGSIAAALGSALVLAVSSGCTAFKVDPPADADGSPVSNGDATLDSSVSESAADAPLDTSAPGDAEAGDAGDGTAPGPDGDVEGGDAADGAGFGLLSLTQLPPRLWLSARRGLTCAGGRVSAWSDLSGNGDDAAPRSGQLGPQCRVGHLANGYELPYFSDPQNGNFIDETLDVDLSFLVGTDYSIFVVERRSADKAPGGPGSFMIGTTEPSSASICPAATDMALQFGYVYYDLNTGPSLAIDQVCDTQRGSVLPADTSVTAPLVIDVAIVGKNEGKLLWTQGAPLGSYNYPPRSAFLVSANGGAVGRALFTGQEPYAQDGRFIGDIAEVIVYDSALSNADRDSVEGYLRAAWGL